MKMAWIYVLMILFIVTVVLLIVLSRICAIILSKILTKVIKHEVSIDYIGFFSLKNITVSLLDSSVVVDELWLSWRVFNSKQKYPAALHVGDIRVRADAALRGSHQSSQSSDVIQSEAKKKSGFMASVMMSFLKPVITLMSCHVHAVNVMFLNAAGTDSLLHITVTKTDIEGAHQNNRKLTGKLAIGQAAVKVLSSTDGNLKEKKSFVVQVASSISSSIVVDLVDKLIDVASISFTKTSLSVHDEFVTSLLKPIQKTSQRKEKVSQDGDSKLSTILQKLPKVIAISLEETSLQLISESSQRSLQLSLDHLSASNSLFTDQPLIRCFKKPKDLKVPQFKTKVEIKKLAVTAKASKKLFYILDSSFHFALSKQQGLTGNVHLSSCHAHISEDEISFWVPTFWDRGPVLADQGSSDREEKIAVTDEDQDKQGSAFSAWQVPVTFDLAMENTSVQLSPKGIANFLTKVRMVELQVAFTPETQLHIQEMKGHLYVEELICFISELGPFPAPKTFPLMMHIFGSPCSLKSLKFEFELLSNLCHFESIVQSFQLESSPYLIQLCKYLLRMLPPPKTKTKSSDALLAAPETKQTVSREIDASFKMEDFSLFLTSNIPCSVVFHVDSFSAGTAEKLFGSEIEGALLQCFSKTAETHSLSSLDSDEGSTTLLNIREINLKHNGCTNEFSCTVPDGLFSSWDTTSHLTVFHHSQELLLFVKETKEILSRLGSIKKQEDDKSSSTLRESVLDCDVTVSITFLQFMYQLSSKNCNSITVHEGYINKERRTALKASAPEVVFEFDGHDIITLKSACMEQLTNNQHHLEVRKGYEQLESPSNWGFGIYTKAIHVVFPWKYDFAANYSEIISINKWLKKLHRKKRSRPDNPPIYPDLILRCQTFSLEIKDDSFEVKLGDNYELMKDERVESDRRKTLLDNKVEELKNQHGQLLPASKIGELYTSLEEKNQEIFLKRSQKLYSTTPMRTALMTLDIKGIEINALCDPSMNGKENIIRHMKEIDPASPYPEGGLDFVTLWCRMVQGHLNSFDLKLRDYPQSLWVIKDMHLWGRLIGAEQVAKPRATREVPVEIQGVWGNDTVIRSMPPLKFFHDLAADIKEWRLAWGPSFEPAWAQIQLCLNLLNKPSVDPSPPLPFWDKIRHLYHGRLIISVEQVNLLWLAMKNPYHTTELLDWEWKNFYMDWQNAHFVIKSDLDIFVRTASKYDDVRLLHLPNVKVDIVLEWLSAGDCNDHHSVTVCAPDKVPEYSSNQTHDSYASFRTHNLNLSLNLDIRGYKKGEPSERLPSCLFYSSTMRWLQNFQSRVLANVTRPTRKGKYFKNTLPRKLQLSRHYKFIEFCASFPAMQVNYWASFAQRQGMELNLGQGSFKSKYNLKLEPIDDGLIHRPRANWSVVGLDFEVVDSQAHLYTTDSGEEIYLLSKSSAQKHHLASVAKVVYTRQQVKGPLQESELQEQGEDYQAENVRTDDSAGKDFVHKLVVHEFCGSWTRFNRDVFFNLFDSYNKAQTLKQNLSTEALKGIKVDANTPNKVPGLLSPQSSGQHSSHGTPSSSQTSGSAFTPSPISRLQGGHGASMLQQLLAETSTKFMVFSEESTNENEQLHGVKACSTEDVIQHNWLIEFVNSQFMLKGLDTSGYVLVTAANAEVMQRTHQPSWREGKLTSKITWVGTLDGLQYFATVDTPSGQAEDTVQWLPTSLIERAPPKATDLPGMVGSGESVGGVVTDTVGPSAKDVSWESVQVQRIISRCGCQFYYAIYGDDVDPAVAAQMLQSSKEMGGQTEEEDNILDKEEAVDSLTLVYHDLNICTNSTQYNMIVDTLNNLLLYVEPKRKEALARIQHFKFALELSSIEDQKGPIMQLQNSLRNLISHLREVEKELYDVHWASEKAPNDQTLVQKTRSLEVQLYEIKESIGNAAEDLRIMVSCFQEIQLQMALKRKLQNAQSIKINRRVELCFGVAKWKLTESDGQLGTADIELRHFKYTRISRDDDSGDNIFELGYVTINNLLANDIYKEVLRPQDPSGNQVVLRVIIRGRPSVGGIAVTEKFELSVIPLSIQLTYRFFKNMMAFFFPRHNVDQEPSSEDSPRALGHDEEDSFGTMRSNKSSTINSTSSLRSTASSDSNTSTLSSQGSMGKGKRKQKNEADDIDKMKERASRNTTFFYIKIPAVPLSVSYKGEKEKNIEDVSNFKLTLPSLEYHNCTWTWLDLLMAMKKEYKQAVLSQAIKEKLKFKIGHKEEGASGSETREDVDKAKLLMGEKLTTIARDEKHSGRRALFGKGQGGS